MGAKVRRVRRLDPNHIIVDFDTELSGVRKLPAGEPKPRQRTQDSPEPHPWKAQWPVESPIRAESGRPQISSDQS
jgi:hypothetical protein